MPDYISLDGMTLIRFEDCAENDDNVVKAILLYKWDDQIKVYVLKEMIPLKNRLPE